MKKSNSGNNDALRAEKIRIVLQKTYPQAKMILRYGSTWELLVAVVLSAQCTDVMVNRVTEKLFTKYKTLDNYRKADRKEFEQDIKSTGFYKNKAKHILSAAHLVAEKHNGSVPDTMEELLTIPGVARKTANIILGNAFGKVVGIAVDTHVQRISQRLRLVSPDRIGGKKKVYFTKREKRILDYKKDADPGKIEKELMEILPRNEWFRFTYLIIEHGRAVCKAQNPKCDVCMLSRICPASRV